MLKLGFLLTCSGSFLSS